MRDFQIIPTSDRFQFTEASVGGGAKIVILFRTRRDARRHLFNRMVTPTRREVGELSGSGEKRTDR